MNLAEEKTQPELKDALIETLQVLKMINTLYYLSDSHNLSINKAIKKAKKALKMLTDQKEN